MKRQKRLFNAIIELVAALVFLNIVVFSVTSHTIDYDNSLICDSNDLDVTWVDGKNGNVDSDNIESWIETF